MIRKCIQVSLMGFFLFLYIGSAGGMTSGDLLSQKISEIESRSKRIASDSMSQEKENIKNLIQKTRDIHRTQHDQSREYKLAREAIDKALQVEDTLLYARALDNLGLLYRYHQWYAQSLVLHRKAFHLIEDRAFPPLYKMIFANNAGLSARYDQQYDLSVSYYLKALKIAESNNNLKNIAISNNGLGNTLSQLKGKEEEALHHFQKAMSAERKRGDSLGIAMNLLSISSYYIDSHRFKEAFATLHQLNKINQKRRDTFGLAITSEFYGHAYLEEGKHLDKAEKYYLRAKDLFQSSKNTLKVAESFSHLGEVYLEDHRLNSALRYYQEAMHIADSLNNRALIKKSAYQISHIKTLQGAYQSALQFFKKGKRYEDSINIDRQKIKIQALNSQFKLEQKEKRIKAQNKEINTHIIFFILIFIAILATSILIIIQYRNRRHKRKIEKELQEKERKLLQAEYERNMTQAEILISRMQINPHFIFNCMNAIKLLIQKKENKKADQYLTTLSRFIRMILEMPKSESISLSEELKLIEYYLTLEGKRFSDAFHYAIHTDQDCQISDIHIPPLLLQPFVENAIWHGLLPSNKDEKRIEVAVRKKEKNSCQIRIEDNGVGRKNKSYEKKRNTKKKSLGTKITQDRIDQFNKTYHCQIKLDIIDKENNNGTIVLLNLINI